MLPWSLILLCCVRKDFLFGFQKLLFERQRNVRATECLLNEQNSTCNKVAIVLTWYYKDSRLRITLWIYIRHNPCVDPCSLLSKMMTLKSQETIFGLIFKSHCCFFMHIYAYKPLSMFDKATAVWIEMKQILIKINRSPYRSGPIG